MFATCIHCQHTLGANALLETLPVGRRIAFDEAAGRLWVICGHCARWNLVPFESRYEAIEACERLFRDTRLRMSTGQIGLAKTSEGTELVRIGAPQRPEMAAWRYAGSLAKRRLRFAVRTAPLTIGLAGIMQVMPMLSTFGGISFLVYAPAMLGSGLTLRHLKRRRLATLQLADRAVDLSRNVVGGIRVDASDPDGMRVLLPTVETQRIALDALGPVFGETDATVIVDGVRAKDDEDADRLQRYLNIGGDIAPLLRVILPIANEAGAPPPVIENAVGLLSTYDADPRQILFGRRKDWRAAKRLTLATVSEPRRLALEMALHEESERRWLAGELRTLEAEWARAEEIAAIADGLVPSAHVEARLDALRGRDDTTPPTS